MKIEEVKLSSLKKTKILKRRHPKDQVERCMHSLMKYGQYSPLVVSGNEILCGNLVFDAMKRLKMKKAKIVQIGELSEEKKTELRYIDNRTFDLSYWKDEELKIFLMSINSESLEDFGFNDEEVEKMINDFDDEIQEIRKSEIREMNQQPDTWFCPECGWTGTINKE